MEPSNEGNTFSLTRLLSGLGKYWREIWKRKWWIVLGAALLSAIMLTIAWTTPKHYNAPLTFMINSDEGSGISGMGAILGELGFAGGRGGHNYEKITQLATSRMILKKVLLTKCDFKGKEDFLGNHFMGIYYGSDSTSFQFTNSRDPEYLAEAEKHIIALTKLLKGSPQQGMEGIITMSYDEESTIIMVNAKTLDPELSTLMANVEYDVLSAFYTQNTIEKQEATFMHISEKADSLKEEIRGAEAQLARYIDQTNGIILQQNRLPREQLARKIEMLYIMYGEAMKNRETSEFLLKNATPYFQVIDRPAGPFQPVGKSRLKSLILGGILGGLLALVIIIGRFWFLEQLNLEQTKS